MSQHPWSRYILVTSANGSCELQSLPDSGADISAAGKETLQTLNEHVNSLIPSRVIPKAANGMKMYPLGKIPVKIQLGCYEHSEELHIYPNISGTLLSWKAYKSLGILRDCYPNPITPKQQSINQITEHTKTLSILEPPTLDNIMKEFPSVFDVQIRTMNFIFHLQIMLNHFV